MAGSGLGERGGGSGNQSGRTGTVPGVAVVARTVLLLHDGRHAVGELGPVGMQPAAPAGREAGEKPGLFLAWPVTGALFLASFAATRLL